MISTLAKLYVAKYTLLCRKDIELHAAYLIHTCTMNYIATPTKNVSTLELKKKDLTEYLTVKKNRDRKALPHLLEFYKREYSSNTTKRDSLNLFEGPCRTRILPLLACTVSFFGILLMLQNFKREPGIYSMVPSLNKIEYQ